MNEVKGWRDEQRTIVEHTSPVWRLLSVALAAGAVVALGYYLQQVGYADAFSTVAAVALVGAINHWAHKRPDQVRLRFGPFSRIADAVRESSDDIRAWTHDRSIRVGLAIYVMYGIALVALKTLIVALLASLYAWPLAVAAGCILGALVAAPEFVSGIFRDLRLTPTSANPGEYQEKGETEKEDEVEERRRLREEGRRLDNPSADSREAEARAEGEEE